ncbi:hypothetical protein Indivirus_6_36 [Indivirus ILV1]|uniref:Sulfhydryl oxidase n=1 Tax=Indivirus ILV1 TaxID=1977633 RepID=A0A1V0SE17_9VIRU|nr:hypothetical protein Indivirus_6_36 [Indivirus ILV1]
MSQLWKELHERAISFTEKNDTLFINQWSAKIPRFTRGCKCHEFWVVWYSKNKPDFSNNPDSYFAWTVKAHNAVNAKLRKKIWTVEEAKTQWTAKTNTTE